MALMVVESGKKCFNPELLNHMKKQKTGKEAVAFIANSTNLRDSVDSSGSTLLHHAALLNCTLVAQHLISQGCDVDARDGQGNTPLMLAVKKCSQRTTGVLLAANADMYVLNEKGKPLVNSVLRSGVDRMVKIFLNHLRTICSDDPDEMARTFERVECPLHVAMSLGRADVIESMLSIGYSANSDDDHAFDESPLHVAVSHGNLEIVKVLVEHGADVNSRDMMRETPLFKYVDVESRNGYPHEILQFFIDRGVDLMATSDLDETLIFELLWQVDKRSVEILAPHVDYSARDRNGKTALHCLASNFHEGVIEVAGNREWDVDARDRNGQTPLMWSVKLNVLDKAKFLLENGANVAAEDSNGETALTLAFTSELLTYEVEDMVRLVEMLLLAGANAQKSFNGGQSIFDAKRQSGIDQLFKPVLADLVLNEASGVPVIEKIRGKIEADEELNEWFGLCKKQYEELEKIKIVGDTNLRDILLEKQEKIELYKRDPLFVGKFQRMMEEDPPNVNSYFLKTLWRRFDDAR